MLISGVDEVGRGPLAGPVMAAAVILDPNNPIEGLRDSKKLSKKKREILFTIIQEKAIAYAWGRADVEEIDQMNILQASLLAMKRAVAGLHIQPLEVLVDGNQSPNWHYPTQTIIGGDDTIDCISAASILAKVIRDREMIELGTLFSGYGFENHKGYGTREHMIALKAMGPTLHHRRSFAPVANLIIASTS